MEIKIYEGVKRYSVTDNWTDIEVLLEIDHGVINVEMANAINSFWAGADNRLAAADDDVIKAVIKMAARNFIWALLENQQMLSMAQRYFDGAEGWPGAGIKLISFDGLPEFDDEGLIVTEQITNPATEGAEKC